ncbi:hypothetical protein CC1G_02613 [Coprinopsis cinerea okayama7|uniref:Uncharacterized protein n=1 Tax=Coprinopsis cinerea (strain Okayama-7 / 130 / ATCC MYA-4618 / FGSC 9003) TaxID=240176 RepID=A8PBC6_COPC7|nr:hypothetical protein CC1G_02613 [Coprinopsis cinerea okayama7\|eukprot:XP_001840150.2 hypothetical protein CC1G_02613 [Coprinopsis cinerea okayama7\
MSSNYSNDRNPPVLAIVAIVVLVVFVIAAVILYSLKSRQLDRETASATANSRPIALRRRGSARSVNNRPDPEILADPPPSYGEHSDGKLVEEFDAEYDVPAAFELIRSIAKAVTLPVPILPTEAPPESSPHPSSTEGSAEEVETLTTYEKMRRTQRLVGDLKRLNAAAPIEGYPVGSPEYCKANRLRESIASLMEPPSSPMSSRAPSIVISLAGSAHWPDSRPSSFVSTSYASSVPSRPGSSNGHGESSSSPSSASHHTHPQRASLYERMLEIQTLLDRIDEITSSSSPPSSASLEPRPQPTSEEVNVTVKELRRRIAELMEQPERSPTYSESDGGVAGDASASSSSRMGGVDRDRSSLPPPYRRPTLDTAHGPTLTAEPESVIAPSRTS